MTPPTAASGLAPHSRFHPYFRDPTLRFGFEDMIFIDNRGTVVCDYLEHSGVMPLGSR
jgi:hypothetical protein